MTSWQGFSYLVLHRGMKDNELVGHFVPLQKTQKSSPFFYSPSDRSLPQQAVLRLREGGKVSAAPQVVALH